MNDIEKLVKKNTSKHKNGSFKKALRNAINGCLYAFFSQKNFIIHFIVSVVVLLLALWLKVSFERFLFLLLVILFCLTIEIANTVFEKTVDLITDEWNPKAKLAKDLAAGMMLMASIGSLIIGFLILLPPLLAKFL